MQNAIRHAETWFGCCCSSSAIRQRAETKKKVVMVEEVLAIIIACGTMIDDLEIIMLCCGSKNITERIDTVNEDSERTQWKQTGK